MKNEYEYKDEEKENDPLHTAAIGMGQMDIVQQSGQAVQIQEPVTRRQIDNPHARNVAPDSYKNRKFDGSRTTTDEYTGKTVFYSSKGQGRGRSDPRHFTTARTANTDHITPIDVLIKRYGNLVPVEDLKMIANSDFNLAITNEALNKRKGGLTNLEYLIEQLEKRSPEDGATALKMLAEQLKSEVGITKDITWILLQDAHQVGLQAAGGTVLMSGAISLVQNICGVCSDDITVEEAAKNIVRSTAEAGVTAYSVGASGSILKRLMLNSKNSAIQKLGSTSLPTLAVTSALEIRQVVKAYACGDISCKEALEQLGKNGAGTLAAGYGAAVGTVLMPGIGTIVGSMLGYMISSSIYDSSMQILHRGEIARENYKRTKELCEASRAAMRQQRLEFEAQVRELLEHRQIVINHSLEKVMDNIESTTGTNVANFTRAMSALAVEFGRELPFQTEQEFDQFMCDDSMPLIF